MFELFPPQMRLLFRLELKSVKVSVRQAVGLKGARRRQRERVDLIGCAGKRDPAVHELALQRDRTVRTV